MVPILFVWIISLLLQITSVNVSGVIRCKVEEGLEKQNQYLYLSLVYPSPSEIAPLY